MEFVKCQPFDECYPPEIVEWINALPSPDDMAEGQQQIARIIDDQRTIAAAKAYFSTLNECDTPEEGNAMIARFKATLEQTTDIVSLFVERLAPSCGEVAR